MPGSLFYTYLKRNGTITPHAKTLLLPDTCLLYLPLHTLPPILNRPLPVPHFPIGLTSPSPIPSHGIYGLAFPYTTVYFQPLKMELIHGSETSAYHILTPGKYPKEHIQLLILEWQLACTDYAKTVIACKGVKFLNKERNQCGDPEQDGPVVQYTSRNETVDKASKTYYYGTV